MARRTDGIFDESHDMLRQTARRFVERELRPHVDEWEEAGAFPRSLYTRAAEAGLLGVAFPEALGGGGGDLLHQVVVTEELTRSGSGGIAAGLLSFGIALPPVLTLGSEEQQRRFVPPVLRGEKVAALAVTEPGGGSDVAGLRTRAVRDGDHYVVNGSKTMITSGCRADLLTVAVRTGEPGAGGLSLLVIEAGTPGFSVSRALRKMGWWASDTAELAFDDVRVPVANRLGPEGAGFLGLMQNFAGERLALAVMATETAALALERALAWTKERTAFGRPLQGFQVTRHRLVEMATVVDVCRTYVHDVARRMAAGEDVLQRVVMAKDFVCEQALRVCDAALQLHGGYGYMRETGVERLYRDARLLTIGGGTTEIMREILSKLML